MHEVNVETLKITLLASVLTPERARRTPKSATRRATFGATRTVSIRELCEVSWKGPGRAHP